ncbi:prepilin-type N-terminal cleavage/methylation domain-containing protein [Sulfitobacter sp. HNIBRBA2951]|uniref:prepilin-type N-terminal cleavage/methylation domain-containing protein n=1 Tax=Sulfitobacter aquimarinus TaxID=3158557 RepID=UPI0032DF423F
MKPAKAGYSLFEVLLAFAIMAMILSVLLPRQTDMLTRLRNIEDRALALDYAMSRLDMLSIVAPLLPSATTDTYRTWTVTENIESTLIAGSDLTALHVEVTVQDQRGTMLATAQMQVIPDEQP